MLTFDSIIQDVGITATTWDMYDTYEEEEKEQKGNIYNTITVTQCIFMVNNFHKYWINHSDDWN